MKILIISQYYKPTRIAATVRMERFVKFLSQKHQVTVLTGFPTLNEPSLKPEYRWKLYQMECDGKVRIVRTYNFFSKSLGFFARTWNQTSFMISSFLVGLFLPKPDLIIATSPPLFVGSAGASLSIFRGIPMVFDVRDLWPESVIVLRLLKNRLAIFLSKAMEKFIYRKSKSITVVTDQIKRELEKRLPDKPIFLLTNATDTDYFKPKNVAKTSYGYSEKDIICTYVGIFSPAQALDKVLASAKILKKEKNIKFLFVGKGDEENRLFRLGKNLKNVRFLPYQPKEEVFRIVNMSDICFISLKKDPLFSGAIPSKVFEYLACEKAVIAAAEGEIEKVIFQNETGVIVPPEKPKLLAEAVLKLAKDEELRIRLGKKGRKLVSQKFSEKTFNQNLQTILKDMK